jgi:HSP20 family protein
MFEALTGPAGSLFEQYRRLAEEMDELFSGWTLPAGIRSAVPGAFPLVNVGATQTAVEVYVFAPGLDPKSIDLSVQENVLTISGKRHIPVNEDNVYYRRERFTGEFRRVITLPDDVLSDQAQARYRDGVLQITLPRSEAVKPRLIEVKAA